jgi:alkaline phosphatase
MAEGSQDQHSSDASITGRGLDRRSFMTAIGAGMATGYAASAARFPSGSRPYTGPAIAPASKGSQRAKNLIFMVSDGMSMGTLQLADLRLRQTRDRPSHWLSLIQTNPTVRRAVIDTASFNSLVTDSAAAATAWGLGVLVENGKIGETPDRSARSPLLLRAKQAGKACGLVTTTRITHATPAGLACNIFGGNRNDEGPIAKQLVERDYHLLLGGGRSRFTEHLKPNQWLETATDLSQRLASDRAANFESRGRLIGLFAESHMAYELDRPSDQPSLADMSRASLEWLDASPSGFVVQIEGGRVDHAAHNNDAGSLIADQVAFDDALGVALEFVSSRDDTLLIITTDHGNANPGLTDYTRMGIEGFARLEGVSRSFDWILAELKDVPAADTERTHAVIELATNISVSRRDLEIIRRWRSGDAVDPFLLANRNAGPLGSILANYTKVAFLSPNHTADYVELTALGPGADRFKPVMQIHSVHDSMCEAIDLPLAAAL